ncbi:hypothetical protein VARIO8X_60152 [Burkholderiales bacterium 8X]|nr:hypothetical protein VARIO8X_60152 [Burkholderiales bacterium 8X]
MIKPLLPGNEFNAGKDAALAPPGALLLAGDPVVADDGTANAPIVALVGTSNGPVAQNDRLSADEDVPIVYTAAQLLGNDSSGNGNPLSIAGVTSGAGGTAVLNADGTVSFTGNLDFNGPASFAYTVSNGSAISNAATVTVDVSAVNDAPVAVTNGFMTARPLSHGSLQISREELLARFTDVDSDLTVTDLRAIAGSTVENPDGSWTYTPGNPTSPFASFTIFVSDGEFTTSGIGVLPITANERPPVAVDDNLGAIEDQPITFTAQQLLANDLDDANEVLTIGSVSSGAGGTAVLNADGTVTFTLNLDFNGTAVFSYKADDGFELSNPATVTVDVSPVNDTPVSSGPAQLGPFQLRDGAFQITQQDLLANFTDVDSPVLTARSLDALEGSVTDNGDGTWTFRPEGDILRQVPLNFRVSDGTATVSGSGFVNLLFDEPVPRTRDDRFEGAEDTVRTFTAEQLFANDLNVADGTARIESVRSSSGGIALLNSDGTVTFTPNANFNGVARFTYYVAANDQLSNPAQVFINLAAVNDQPVAAFDQLTATEDLAVTYTAAQLLGNDRDIENTALTIASVQSGAGGSAVLNANGTVTFTPTANFNGTAGFSYLASDGAATSNRADVSVAVAPVNDAPTLGTPLPDRSYARLTPILFTVPAATFSDPEGDAITYSATLADGSALPNWLQFVPSYRTFAGLPGPDQLGALEVRVSARDANGAASSDTFVLNVTTAPGDIVGTAGNETLSGNNNINVLYGLAGNDSLNGNGDNDLLVGGAGNDRLDGGKDIDAMYGGTGDDTFVVDGGLDLVIERANEGRDAVQASASHTLADNVEELLLTGTSNIDGTGNALDNLINGNGGRNALAGGAGNDLLRGGGEADTLRGGAGIDILVGGLGKDLLYGNAGTAGDAAADTFVFNTALNASNNVDTIYGFEASAIDKIALDPRIFAALAGGPSAGLDATEFRASNGGNAADANDFILYDTATGNLYYDANGSGSGGRVQFASLSGAIGTLDFADFTTTVPLGA